MIDEACSLSCNACCCGEAWLSPVLSLRAFAEATSLSSSLMRAFWRLVSACNSLQALSCSDAVSCACCSSSCKTKEVRLSWQYLYVRGACHGFVDTLRVGLLQINEM